MVFRMSFRARRPESCPFHWWASNMQWSQAEHRDAAVKSIFASQAMESWFLLFFHLDLHLDHHFFAKYFCFIFIYFGIIIFLRHVHPSRTGWLCCHFYGLPKSLQSQSAPQTMYKCVKGFPHPSLPEQSKPRIKIMECNLQAAELNHWAPKAWA